MKGRLRWLIVYAGALALVAGYAIVERHFVDAQAARALQAADGAIELARAELDRRGALAADSSGALRVGRTALAGDEAIVDRVERATGFDCTLFAGDERIASSTRVRGGRNVGTRAPARIANRVLRRGQTVRGQTYGRVALVSRYDPLQTRDGQIVGMVAVFRPVDAFLGGRSGFRSFFAVLLAVALGLATVLARGWRAKAERPGSQVPK